MKANLNIRMEESDLDLFRQRAKEVSGKPHQVLLREIITAYNDNRLRIIPTGTQTEELYLDRE